MEFINLYNALKDFFLEVDGLTDTDNFFFSFQKNGYPLEDVFFQTASSAMEKLSEVVDSGQTFSANLHYYTGVDKKFSEYYKDIIIDQGQPYFKSGLNPAQRQQIQLDFDRLHLRAANQFDLFGELASGNGLATTFKPSLFEPLEFAHDNEFWQRKDFTLNLADPLTAPTVVSFEYVKVKVTYHWFNREYVAFQNWYVPEFGSCQAIADGLFAIPHEIVIIRNLSITGTWSADTMPGPGSIDPSSPFSYSSGTVPISETRMQIIGWVFEKLPATPPYSDPAVLPKTLSLTDKASTGMWSQGILSENTLYGPAPFSPQPIPQPIGQAGVDRQVRMEDGNRYNALRIWPAPMLNGTIKGVIGPLRITGGGNFSGRFGLFAQSQLGPPGIGFDVCVVQVKDGQLLNKVVLFSGTKYTTGSLQEVQGDISRWVGRDVYIELNVYAGNYYLGAMAYWVDPAIQFF